jgi:hypothetical protein
MGAVRRPGLIALVACGLAFSWTMQGTGDNQNSHYALVRALANGTASIDATRGEVGNLNTHDVTYHGGRAYSNKAPGLAFLSLPFYLALRAAGVVGEGDPTRVLWALGLVGCVTPAVVLLVLVRRSCERLEPGFGTPSAVVLGLGTLLLPFAALYFAHALSAFLVFAAFALLLRERQERMGALLVGAAGLTAGLSIVTEYPNVIAAAALLLYACAGPKIVQRGAAYCAGLLAGVTPLLAYQYWAFGSLTRLSYAGPTEPGREGDLGTLDLVSLGSPDPVVLLETLFSTAGLLTLAPVIACAAVALPIFFRRGHRAEALVVGAICLAWVVYNSSFGSSFGGFSPGQRYLVPALAFLALPLAVALRRFPATTTALALVSTIVAVTTTATHALAGYNVDWFDRVASLDFTFTAARLVEVTGWYTILPLFAAAGLALVAAAFDTQWVSPRGVEVAFAGVASLAWALVAATAPRPPTLGGNADSYGAYGAIAVALLVVTLGACAVWLAASRRPPRPAVSGSLSS